MSDLNSISLPPLSERLAAAVAFVKCGNRAVDVGCDHGYTAIYLRNAGICPFCICTDIHAGPLEAASANITRYNADGIVIRLCDGLSGVLPGEAETVIITGMGGELICRILENGKNVVFSAQELVLGPQSEPEKVRSKIYELGYHISDEAFVCEDGKYYPVIRAIRWAAAEPCCEFAATGAPEMPRETELKYGPELLRKQPPELCGFLMKERTRYESILARLDTADGETDENRNRKEEIRHELDLIEQALKVFL